MKRAPLKTSLVSWAPSINIIITILKHIKYCSKSKKNTHLKKEVVFSLGILKLVKQLSEWAIPENIHSQPWTASMF